MSKLNRIRKVHDEFVAIMGNPKYSLGGFVGTDKKVTDEMLDDVIEYCNNKMKEESTNIAILRTLLMLIKPYRIKYPEKLTDTWDKIKKAYDEK